MKNLRSFAWVALLGFMLLGCYPIDDGRTFDETFTTVTNYDTDFFPDSTYTYSTFSLTDSVKLIDRKDNIIDPEEFYEKGGWNDQILAQIREGFLAKGYTEVPREDNPDFGVNAAAVVTKTTQVGWLPWYGPGYWYWWGGWYPPYYPWNPGYTYAYTYETGYLMFEMADGDSWQQFQLFHAQNPNINSVDNSGPPPEGSQLKFRWQAIVTGLLSNNNQYNYDRIERGINEAFEQSPYLDKKQPK
ncbi:hypothetical protein AUTU_47030 (plasmid) [Aureibacter tunicatorum]|nr:hypothetical protein AUTU_47030 [Aureibacter tunicatorum]